MSLPDIRQLSIFIALEETRSFTEAAKACFITQSAVSHSIKSLEKQLDCALFERLGKRLILTPAGEVFLHHAKRVIRELETGLSKLATLKLWGYSSIRVGIPDSLSQHILPNILKDFTEKHPRCEIIVTLGDTSEVLQLIKDGNLDLAFGIHLAPQDPQLTFTPLCTDSLCLITNPDHPWNNKNNDQALNDLSKIRLISYSATSATQRLISKHLNELAIQHHQPLTVGNMEAIKEMVKLGLGVGIIPSWLAHKELEQGSLTDHPISTPPLLRQWGIFSPGHKTLSLPQEDFMKIANKYLRSAVSS